MRLRWRGGAAIVVGAMGAGWGAAAALDTPSPERVPAVRTGRIEGTAVLAPRLTTRRLRVRVYAEPGLAPPSTEPDSTPLTNVVVYLDLPAASASSASQRLMIRQRGERFRPHVLAVRAGSIVEFPNEDPIYHNVFSLSSARTFDLGRYPAGESKSVDFPRPGIVQVFCHIHADMSAYVLVFDHPFFTVPDAGGRFAIEDLPPGDHELVAWHERIKPLKIPVHVEAGRTTTVHLNIPIMEGS